jgi:O-antigen ligase
MNRNMMDTWCERGILALVLAILVFGPLATGAVETWEFLIIQALTTGVMLLWCFRLWLNPRPKLLWPPICWPALGFAIYAVVRYFTADIEYVARLEVFRVLICTFLFLAILNNLHRQEPTHVIVYTLIFLAMAISCYAIYQFCTGSDRVWNYIRPEYAHRGSGTFISPNNLGGFLEMILPLGLAFTIVSRARVVTKIFVGYASAVILAGIAVTVSRGAWIATGLALVVFFVTLLFHRSYRLPSLAMLAVVVAAGVYFMPRQIFFHTRFKEIYAEGKIGDNARFALWKPAADLWGENPWFGIGPNHFNYRFRQYRPETIQLQPDRVHNDYLNTLTDWGITGTALVVSAWIFLWLGVFKTWRYVRGSVDDFGRSGSNRFAVLLGGAIGLLAILFHSVVDFNMHIPANAILAITLMAMVSGGLRFATDAYWIAPAAWLKAVLTLVLLAGIGCFAWQGARGAAECVWLDRAGLAPELSPEKIAALKKAAEIEPNNFETAYALGEAFRLQSWEGDENYRAAANNAMKYFEQDMKLNRFDGYAFLRYGMCLDWLGDHDKAWPYYDRAIQLDPNGYFLAENVGWHYVQVEDYAAAKAWFERSRKLQMESNPVADAYLQIVTQKMLEAATNSSSAVSAAPSSRE